MQSHAYNYTGQQILRAVVPTLAVFLGCVAALHLADWAGWLPRPPTALHADETGLRHQAKVSRSRHPAQIVFVGDSTCGVAVDASALSDELPGRAPAINLSLLIGIDLGTYAEMTADFAASNPGQVRWVILLVCPAKLAGGVESAGWTELLNQFRREYAGQCDRRPGFWSRGDYFGGQLLRERFACRILPEALRGRGASFFGFTRDLDVFMTVHNGSLLDFGEFSPRQDQPFCDWSVAPAFESECRNFRKKMAPGAKLAIGLTPVALAGAPPNAGALHKECLQQWNAWIQADLVLSNLPAALPTPCFGSSGHMNALGQRVFTSAVAKELSQSPR